MFRNLLKTTRHPRSRSPISLRLEELEARQTLSATIATATNASLQIIPNLSAFTVTEKVTVTVTNAPTYFPLSGTTESVPPGTPPPSGTVFFNLNNQQKQAQLDSNGQATATFTMPLLVFFTSQELTAQYAGASITSPSVLTYQGSTFNAPLYLNFDNLLLGSNVTFNALSTQTSTSPLPPYNTAQGETDNFGPFSFQYADPGLITGVQAFGHEFPGIYAAAFGAYGPEFMGSNGGGASTRSFVQ